MRNNIFLFFVRLGTLDQSIFINQYPSKSYPSTYESLSCRYDCVLGRIIADVKKQHANTHTHMYENMICVKTWLSGWSEGEWQGVGVDRVWRALWAVGGEGGGGQHPSSLYFETGGCEGLSSHPHQRHLAVSPRRGGGGCSPSSDQTAALPQDQNRGAENPLD